MSSLDASRDSSSEPIFDAPSDFNQTSSPETKTSNEPGDYRPRGPKLPSIDEYRRLTRSTTQWGFYTGCAGGGLLAYIAHRRGFSRNTSTLAFLLGGTTISFVTTTRLLHKSLYDIYTKAYAAGRPQSEGGGGPLLDDSATMTTDEDAASQLSGIDNKISGRTRWAKGRGLDGEVEEENEMRDTFFRPGVPRV